MAHDPFLKPKFLVVPQRKSLNTNGMISVVPVVYWGHYRLHPKRSSALFCVDVG